MVDSPGELPGRSSLFWLYRRQAPPRLPPIARPRRGRRLLKRRFRRVFLLVVVLALSAPSSAALAADRASAQGAEAAQTQVQASFPASTAAFDKTEVVYVSLDATGAARAASVVNMFDVESGGQIVDFGPYDDVLSLSEDKALSREGQATSFSVGEGTFLYQGDISQPVIPWSISLSYELDGRSVSADEVAGAEGEVTIHLKTGRNEDADRAFYDSYMLQATFTLPAGTCSDVVAEQATLAMSGEDRTVAFTVLPGHDGDFTIKMNARDFALPSAQIVALPYTSVIEMPSAEDRTVAFTVLPGHDGDFTIKMNARDFALPSAQIVALPYTSVIEMPSADGMVDGISQLGDAVSRLASGASQLDAGSSEFASGVDDFAVGSAQFGEGLSTLAASSDQLTEASAQVNAAFTAVGEALGRIDLSQVDELAKLPGLMRDLADALDAVAGTASEVSGAYSAAYGELAGSMDAIPDGTVSDDQMEAIRQLADTTDDAADDETVETLVSTYRAAQSAKQTFAEHRDAFDAAKRNLEATAQLSSGMSEAARLLRVIADEFDASIEAGGLEDLKGLLGGVGELAQGYSLFHQGLVSYTDGVKALASNYAQMNAGAQELSAGAGRLAQGVSAYSGGVSQLNNATIDLPQTMKDQIASMMSDYDFPAFEPRSFTSQDNTSTSEVQFVISTPAIEKEVVQVAEEPEVELSFWDRLFALFS